MKTLTEQYEISKEISPKRYEEAIHKVTGRFGRESFRPWVVSAVVRFGLGRFGLSRFGPGSFRPILVSRFGLIFLFNPYILYNILYARCICYTRLLYHAVSLARVPGSISG